MDNKRIHILGGGTFSHVASHLSLCAPAFGTTAKKLARILTWECSHKMEVMLELTRMAWDGSQLVTNEDVEKRVQALIDDDRTKIIVFNVAMCDFDGFIDGRSGKYVPRPDSQMEHQLELRPKHKVVASIRKQRKDIFLVAFKETCGASEDEQYIRALNLCKQASANLVFANDTQFRRNMIVTPEEARYHVIDDRNAALKGLAEMMLLRSHLSFTRSTVVDGMPISWGSSLIPKSLRTVVNYCIEQGAYKPFRGSTAGHFAHKLDDTTFLTSIRKTDFNDLPRVGLVKVKTDGPDSVLAYGAKPSVGGQSQRIVFHDHTEYDCILHFHCPMKAGSQIPIASQREFECGSHECGKNTSGNLKKFGNLSAVYLDQHGPNIVFHSEIDPQEVINFINDNFDLSQKTGGFVSIQQRLETPDTLDDARKLLT